MQYPPSPPLHHLSKKQPGGGRGEQSTHGRKKEKHNKSTNTHKNTLRRRCWLFLLCCPHQATAAVQVWWDPSFLPLVLLTPFMIEEEGFSESEWESMHDLKKKPHSIIHNNKQPSSRLSIGPSCAQRERQRQREFGCQELYQFAFFKTNSVYGEFP